MLRIRIQNKFFRIRSQIQDLGSNPQFESLANYLNPLSITQIFYLHLFQKLNNFQWCEWLQKRLDHYFYSWKMWYFFKIAIFHLFLSLYKKTSKLQEKLSVLKGILHFKKWNLITFFYFCGSFLPSRIRIRLPNHNPLIWLIMNPLRIRTTAYKGGKLPFLRRSTRSFFICFFLEIRISCRILLIANLRYYCCVVSLQSLLCCCFFVGDFLVLKSTKTHFLYQPFLAKRVRAGKTMNCELQDNQ